MYTLKIEFTRYGMLYDISKTVRTKWDILYFKKCIVYDVVVIINYTTIDKALTLIIAKSKSTLYNLALIYMNEC